MTDHRSGGEPAIRVIVRAAIYYAALFGVGAVIWRWLPHDSSFAPATLETLLGRSGNSTGAALEIEQSLRLDDISLALTVAVAMVAAVLLAIPVAWIYQLTRAKLGYKQSIVQLLIMLPAVVAGIVVLVKYSIALAFGLAGIVAAVRFRNSLDDSKDAVYVFLATAIGLSAAVNLPVAAVMSLCFNATVLFLWFTDFGRTPVELDGRIAERRLKRARQLARTGTFVAQIDEEVLRNMSREQLTGIAERAWKRATATASAEPANVSRESLLRIHTRDRSRTRSLVEARLDDLVKEWRARVTADQGSSANGVQEGVQVLEYHVRLRKRVSRDELTTALVAIGGGDISDVEIV